MNLIKLIVVLGIIGGGYQYWKGHNPAYADEFIAIPPAEGFDGKAVLVIAAQNCPQEAAQRADSLAEELSKIGIPVVRTQNIGFNFSVTDLADAARVMSIMKEPPPIVIVNGRAKSNPSLEQVIAEYKTPRL